jgi:hypothetical protein
VLGPSILHPWPRVHRLVGGMSPSGDPWLALPMAGRGAVWSEALSQHRRHRGRAHCRHQNHHAPMAQPSSSSVWPPCMQTAHLVDLGSHVHSKADHGSTLPC